jgi:hypothetical protein
MRSVTATTTSLKAAASSKLCALPRFQYFSSASKHMNASAQHGGAAANIRGHVAGSSSSDSEGYGYPSTLCPAITQERDCFIDFYGDISSSDEDEEEDEQFNRAVTEELQEIDDDVDDLQNFENPCEEFYEDPVPFVSEYNRVAPLCGWSGDARSRKKQLLQNWFGKEYYEDIVTECCIPMEMSHSEDAERNLTEHIRSGGNLHSSAAYAAIDLAEDEELFEEEQSEADNDFSIACERLDDSVDEFRRIVRKYCSTSIYAMVHRCGRPYFPAQQPAPRQLNFRHPALSHPSRSRLIRSGGMMLTLLRRLSLFNATPDFSVLNIRFISDIGRRCCSIFVTQLHSILDCHIERRIAFGSQCGLPPHAANTTLPPSFVVLRRFMNQNCFILPATWSKGFRPLTLAPYCLGMSAEAVEAECPTAADVESKLEELEDMYQVRERMW